MATQDTVTDPRTLSDVEHDLREAGALLVNHRSRQGETVAFRERCEATPALLVRPVDWLLEEWQALHVLG